MSDFENRLACIDRPAIKKLLLELEEPCFEATLWKVAFPGERIDISRPLELYQNHFLLFHLLYLLQEEFRREDLYLHVHFMRIRPVPFPAQGRCRHFLDNMVRFCAAPCRDGSDYCNFHLDRMENGALEELSARTFYLDRENFTRLDGETARAFVSGSWEYLGNYERFRESFRILELPDSADLNLLKSQFRKLARQCHPDVSREPDRRFKELNNAYQVLLRYFSSVSGRSESV